MNIRVTAPTAPVVQPPELIDQQRSLLETTFWGVLANCARAVFAGLGVGLVIACVLWWVGCAPLTVGAWALRTWGIVAGVLLFVLHTDDKIRAARWQWTTHNTYNALAEAEDTIDALEADNQLLLRENSILRWNHEEDKRHANYIRPVAIESQAYGDARTLIRQWGDVGEHPARRKVRMTDARHRAAMDVLEACGIIERPTQNKVNWLASDAAAALLMLDANNDASPE